jgi:hypothetical protein
MSFSLEQIMNKQKINDFLNSFMPGDVVVGEEVEFQQNGDPEFVEGCCYVKETELCPGHFYVLLKSDGKYFFELTIDQTIEELDYDCDKVKVNFDSPCATLRYWICDTIRDQIDDSIDVEDDIGPLFLDCFYSHDKYRQDQVSVFFEDEEPSEC